MTEKIIYTTLLLINGFLWIALTLYFRSIIKKKWLYTLFPVVINATCCAVLITFKSKQILLIPLSLALLYYVFSIIKGMKLIDVLTIPFIINIIIIATLI